MKHALKLIHGILFVVLLCANVNADNVSSDQVGDRFHDFKFFDPAGEAKSISDYRGQVLLVKVWGSWCGICQSKWPEYQQMYDQLKDNTDVQFITIGLAESIDTSRAWTDSQGYSVPLFKNTYSVKGALRVKDAEDYFINGTPQYYLIDRDGRLVKKAVGREGHISVEDISAAI